MSIWISSDTFNRKFAVVFDLATGNTLTTLEVENKLGLNIDQLEKAYQSIPNYSYRVLQLENYETLSFNTTKFFINSKGKMAYDDGNDIILFEWEEVR